MLGHKPTQQNRAHEHATCTSHTCRNAKPHEALEVAYLRALLRGAPHEILIFHGVAPHYGHGGSPGGPGGPGAFLVERPRRRVLQLGRAKSTALPGTHELGQLT